MLSPSSTEGLTVPRAAFSDNSQRSTSSDELSYGQVIPRSQMSLAPVQSPFAADSNGDSGPHSQGQKSSLEYADDLVQDPFAAYGVPRSQTDSSSGAMLARKRREDSEETTRMSTHPRRATSSIQPSVPQRTIDDVRDQVAQSIAFRTVMKAENIDGSKVGVVLTLTSSSGADRAGEIQYLRLIASKISQTLLTSTYIFIIGTSGLSTPGTPSPILILSSSPEFIHRATMLVNTKFVGRLIVHPTLNHEPSGKRYYAEIKDLGESIHDEQALWDVVRKSARNPIDPLVPPPGSLSIRQILAVARSRLQRISPHDAYLEVQTPDTDWPVILIDIRPQQLRSQEGEIPGALLIERNVLEWRFDPRGKVGDGEDGGRLPIADRFDLRLIIFCQEGYTSSLAATSLHDIGLLNATDIIGGFKAWKEAGFPVHVPGQ